MPAFGIPNLFVQEPELVLSEIVFKEKPRHVVGVSPGNQVAGVVVFQSVFKHEGLPI